MEGEDDKGSIRFLRQVFVREREAHRIYLEKEKVLNECRNKLRK